MKNACVYVLVLLLGIIGGWICRKKLTEKQEPVVQKDTLYYRDTITVEKPVEIYNEKGHLIEVVVRDTVRIHDTLYMHLQTEKKIYKEDDFYVEISGYHPHLDYIQVYPQTRYLKETKTEYIRHKERIALGFEVAYTCSPFIPIYLEYGRMLHDNVELYGKLLYDIPSQSFGVGVGIKTQIGW